MFFTDNIPFFSPCLSFVFGRDRRGKRQIECDFHNCKLNVYETPRLKSFTLTRAHIHQAYSFHDFT